jgi:Domain of unknown function (DUF4167)
MRSSKSRSRSKNNRNRSVGNVTNRVFDSSGPEGKVRGTPQQIIEKYTQLARDAQLSNDRVAAENFQQHAEHYTRLLGEAQRELDARREQQEREHRERQQARADQPRGDQPRGDQQRGDQQRGDQQRGDQPRRDAPRPDAQATDRPQGDAAQPAFRDPAPVVPDPSQAEQPDILPSLDAHDSGLVDTPEEAPAPVKRRPRKPRAKAKPATEASTDTPAPDAPADDKSQPGAPEAAE